MAESLPAPRAFYKKTTDPDNAWVEAVGREFQADPNVEYEICCVGPSDIAKKTWISAYGDVFVLTVRTTAPNETFTWPGRNQATDALFDWGDGTSDTITAYNQAELTHTYATAGDHDIKVSGTCGAPLFNNAGDKLKAVNVKNWGNLGGATEWNSAFYGCSNLIVDATDEFGANVTTVNSMFRGCSIFNQSIANFNTLSVTNMFSFLRDCISFSQQNVDLFLQRLYQDRLLRTSPAPLLALIVEPSGIYQDANPPTTGNEYKWQLENGADVIYKWTIT